MSDQRHEGWQEPYEEAVREIDADKLALRIREAEAAIFMRLKELQIMTAEREVQASQDALGWLFGLTARPLN